MPFFDACRIFFFPANMVKPVGETISSVYCTTQQPQKAEVEMSQEQEKAIKKTSLVARMDEKGLHVQVENTTSHYLFDVEWERFLGKVTAQMGLPEQRYHLHITSKCLHLGCFHYKKGRDRGRGYCERKLDRQCSSPPLTKAGEDHLISDGSHLTTPSLAPEHGRKLCFPRFRSLFPGPASSCCLLPVFRTSA